MNPVRKLLMGITRIPPAVLLMTIVGIAAVVTAMVSQHLDTNDKVAQQNAAALTAKLNQMGKAVVAIKDIPEGEVIASSNLEEREMQVGKIPEDAIPSASLVSGRISKYGISANQIVSQHDLAMAGVNIGFETKVKAGSRAITFAVDNNSGVAGFITPDSHIDILSMVGNGADTKAAPILSDVQVVAVGQMYQKTPGGTATPSSSLTVAVSPGEAQKLVKAISASKIYVALRNASDHEPVATVDVTQMYKKENSKSLISSIDNLPAPSNLAPPPLPMTEINMSAGPVPATTGFQPSNHEVELWSGSKKDLLSVPRG
jgi:pilus assembly protein CpaB